MFDTSWIAGLDADAACRAIAGTQVDLRESEWRELALAAHWADLHDEHTLPTSGGSVLGGMERATPWTSATGTRSCGPGWVPAWVGCGRPAGSRLTHDARLSLEHARAVDAAVAPYVDSLAFTAFTALVEARIVEADPTAAEARRVAEALSRFVSTGQSDEFGLKTLIVKANAGDVIFFVAMCDRIAQCLLADGDADPVDVRRSKAVGILAQPALALALLQKHATGDQPPGEHPVPFPVDVDRLRPAATLFVRVSEEAVGAGSGVAVCGGARGAESVGVVTVQQIKDLLGHCRVTVRPVLDLRDQLPVDAYEVPAAMREALKLTRPSSIFPFSHTASEPDLDHTGPYLAPDAGGPPGQTRVENLGPLTRFTHRVKTHGRGRRHHQPIPGVYLWRTPHGYWFRVGQHGTQAITQQAIALLDSPSAHERALARLVLAA